MSPSARPIIILLVEDSTDDVFFFRRAVQKTGFTVAMNVAGDGVEAMDYLRHKDPYSDATAFPPPDIMFLDIKLPHCNGFELLDWMRRHAECSPIPVVILTSSSQAEDQHRAEALGAVLYLTKPAEPDQLGQALRKFALARLEGMGRPKAV